MTITHRAKSPVRYFKSWSNDRVLRELRYQSRQRGEITTFTLCELCFAVCRGGGPCADCCRGEIERRKRGAS